ncbi:pentapeptide repeat-containing protein [Bradyrhizobium sp. 5.13L]
MKTTDYTDDPINPAYLDRIPRLLDLEDTNFVNQAKFCGLDPATDFQNLDLCDVDFSDCDLRGFNFSGSDLRGSYGVNVRWEVDDPIFDGADTDDSIFAHRLAQANYFQQNPDELEVVDRLSTDYWANVIIRVDELLQDRASDRGAQIARALFDRSKDASVRMNILLFMRVTTTQSSQHKVFIFDILSQYTHDVSVILVCLRAMNVFYVHDRTAFSWLLRFLAHPDGEIRRIAFRGIVRSRRFMEGIEQARSYVVARGDSPQRRAFVGAAAAGINSRVESAVYNWRNKCFYDFLETLTPLSVLSWDEEEFRRFKVGRNSGATSEKAERDDQDASAQKAFFMRRLNLIGKFGKRYRLFFKYQQTARSPIVELGRADEVTMNKLGLPSAAFD